LAAAVAAGLGANGSALADPQLRALAKEKFGGVASLEEVAVPKPSNLDDFVKDKKVAIALGKAFFWDVQVGSELEACASCHFHAGGDKRVKNQLSPGLLRVTDPSAQPDPDNTFGYAATGAMAGPNYKLSAADYPFHQLSDPKERNSTVTFETNDVTSSQGTFFGHFVSVPRRKDDRRPYDNCDSAGNPFHVNGVPVRKVEPRNSPTHINAVFNHRNFWDGRASNIFNGLNPFGRRGNLPAASEPKPGVLVMRSDGSMVKRTVEIDNASLASQAVGPPLSDFEMSCAGRTFADLGRKLRTRTALALQDVAPDDSVLGPYAARNSKGLTVEYSKLVKDAFQDKYWAKDGKEQRFTADGEPLPAGVSGYTQMEVNWALFYGLAIQLYEATLVSDKTRVDAFMKGNDAALNAQEKLGFRVFLDKGKCVNCHVGPEFTNASVRMRARKEAIERMPMGDGGTAVYDGGFYNIGVRPTREDLGVGAEVGGFPLSFARQAAVGPTVDLFEFNPSKFDIPGPIVTGERVAVDGAFKTSSLRNVELTGPYFHNGGYSTLRQVVDFYNRGGNRRNANRSECPDVDPGAGVDHGDTTGFAAVCSNVAPDITKLGLSDAEADALVAFMLALTDERVKYERAPFDHPELVIPHGHRGDRFAVISAGTGLAQDDYLSLTAVGAGGRRNPLQTFLELSPFSR
jgi:cytochrome c peroxidase